MLKPVSLPSDSYRRLHTNLCQKSRIVFRFRCCACHASSPSKQPLSIVREIAIVRRIASHKAGFFCTIKMQSLQDGLFSGHSHGLVTRTDWQHGRSHRAGMGALASRTDWQHVLKHSIKQCLHQLIHTKHPPAVQEHCILVVFLACDPHETL